GRMKEGKLVAAELSAAELNRAWDGVTARDGLKAHRAVWTLVAAPNQAVPLLCVQLKPAGASDRARLERLLEQLDDDSFARREKASEEMEKMGVAAVPLLKKAQEKSASVEVRTRIRRLLGVLEGPGARDQTLREARGVEILEHIGDAEARRLLQ